MPSKKGLSVGNEALLRELVLSKNVGFLSLTEAWECVKRQILAGIWRGTGEVVISEDCRVRKYSTSITSAVTNL
jgi:hypothetical protein